VEVVMPGSCPEGELLSTGKYYRKYFDIILAIVAFRLILSFFEPYPVDMAGYYAWSRYLAEFGPSQFYVSSGFHVVYAPFFQYFLWLTGELSKLFSLTSFWHIYLIKIWSVIFEFIGALLIIKLSKKANLFKQGLLMALFYVINPGIFMNSSIWGQFDSIPATMLLGAMVLFEYGKKNYAALLYLVSVLAKPQSGLLLPIILFLYFRDFKFDKTCLSKLVTGLISGIILYLAIVLPFYTPTSKAGLMPSFIDPFYWLFNLYFRSVGDYPYATANAFNFWTLLGGQIKYDSLPLLGLKYSTWGNILFAAGLFFVFWCLIKGKGTTYAVVWSCFMVQFTSFLFITRMHERYLLPAVIFITMAAVFNKRHLVTAIILSICIFINQLYIYIISFENQYWLGQWDALAIIIAAVTVVTYMLSLFQGYKLFILEKRECRGDKY
jgi:Gpi18-like mannosyltransferase